MSLFKTSTKLAEQRARHSAGFTLVEMLIVVALIAMIGTFVTINVSRRFDEAKVSATKIQIRNLGVSLDDFRRVCGFYPTTDQGLDALVKAPVGRECKNWSEGFLKDKKVPQDAWNNDFLYESDGNAYKISSLGNDKQTGGSGAAADITSDDPN